MHDYSCKFCGGGKFTKFPTWWECWHCGSEFKPPEQPIQTQVLVDRRAPYSFGATYFTPYYSSYGPFRQLPDGTPLSREIGNRREQYNYNTGQWDREF